MDRLPFGQVGMAGPPFTISLRVAQIDVPVLIAVVIDRAFSGHLMKPNIDRRPSEVEKTYTYLDQGYEVDRASQVVGTISGRGQCCHWPASSDDETAPV